MDEPIFVTRLREIREQRGMSLREFARLCGFPTSRISNYENGRDANPTARSLVQIARTLSVSTDYLLGLVDEPVQQHLGEPLSEYEHRIIEHVREHDANGAIEVWLEMDLMSKAEWRPVVGYEGLYEVSNAGYVRSLPRGSTPGQLMAQHLNSNGYFRVRLSNCNGGKHEFVHILVAEAFIGPRPEGLVIDHIDGNRKNNHADNLEYVTQKENIRRACEHGTMDYHDPNRGNIKLNPEAVVVIRTMANNGLKDVGGQETLARAFGVEASVISMVINRKTWKHVDEKEYAHG